MAWPQDLQSFINRKSAHLAIYCNWTEGCMQGLQAQLHVHRGAICHFQCPGLRRRVPRYNEGSSKRQTATKGSYDARYNVRAKPCQSQIGNESTISAKPMNLEIGRCQGGSRAHAFFHRLLIRLHVLQCTESRKRPCRAKPREPMKTKAPTVSSPVTTWQILKRTGLQRKLPCDCQGWNSSKGCISSIFALKTVPYGLPGRVLKRKLSCKGQCPSPNEGRKRQNNFIKDNAIWPAVNRPWDEASMRRKKAPASPH